MQLKQILTKQNLLKYMFMTLTLCPLELIKTTERIIVLFYRIQFFFVCVWEIKTAYILLIFKKMYIGYQGKNCYFLPVLYEPFEVSDIGEKSPNLSTW